jgi:hypothetical protein
MENPLWHPKEEWRHAQREDREGRSDPAGGSGGGTDDKWTEEDFKRRVRERLDSIEGHLDRIDQRLDRIERHGDGPSGGRGGAEAKAVVKAAAKGVAEDAVAASAWSP